MRPPVSVLSPASRSAPGADRWLLVSLFIVYLVWGSTFLAMRVAIESFPPLLMAALRHGIAGALLFLVALARGGRLPARREWLSAGALGFLLLVVGNGSVAYAQQWVPSSLAAMLGASIPLLAAIAGGLFGRWPRRADWAALALGLLGVLLISRQAGLVGGAGLGLLLLGAAGSALGVVLAPRLPRAPGLIGVAAQLLVAGGVLGLASFAHGDSVPAAVDARSLAALAYLVIFGSLIAFAAYNHLLLVAPPALATSNNFVNPVVAMLLGATLAGERLGAGSILGMALVLLALAAMMLPRPKLALPRARPAPCADCA
jgi:drug/metabolite transporter (DMT)-like permease